MVLHSGRWFCTVINGSALWKKVLHRGKWFYTVVNGSALVSLVLPLWSMSCTSVNGPALWLMALHCVQWLCTVVNGSALWSMALHCGQCLCTVVNGSAHWPLVQNQTGHTCLKWTTRAPNHSLCCGPLHVNKFWHMPQACEYTQHGHVDIRSRACGFTATCMWIHGHVHMATYGYMTSALGSIGILTRNWFHALVHGVMPDPSQRPTAQSRFCTAAHPTESP
jgi:hypothetical protein